MEDEDAIACGRLEGASSLLASCLGVLRAKGDVSESYQASRISVFNTGILTNLSMEVVSKFVICTEVRAISSGS